MRPLITITLSLVLALVSAALHHSTPPAAEGRLNGATIFQQPTSTPPAQGRSEIGSTDGILIMGVLISLIVIVPLLLRRQSWMESR